MRVDLPHCLHRFAVQIVEHRLGQAALQRHRIHGFYPDRHYYSGLRSDDADRVAQSGRMARSRLTRSPSRAHRQTVQRSELPVPGIHPVSFLWGYLLLGSRSGKRSKSAVDSEHRPGALGRDVHDHVEISAGLHLCTSRRYCARIVPRQRKQDHIRNLVE